MAQSYRNARTGYLTDILVDTTPIGAIVPNLKTGQNSYDHNFVRDNANQYPGLKERTGNSYISGDDPAYTHEGYLYCDGSEYNIADYPALFEIIGNDYGGNPSSGIDVINGGSGFTSVPTISLTAPPLNPPLVANPIVATAEAIVDLVTGTITRITVTNPGSGYDYNNPPAVTVTGGGGSGATFSVRVDPVSRTIVGIAKNNVMDWWGDSNLGTFAVPDTVAKKIVGNGPVYGNNSPNIGNSSLGVGTIGGGWYLDQNLQDDYFSLGRITTTGYDQVIETTGVDIIGSHTITITMRDTKLGGVPQHSHVVYHSIPGSNVYISEASGDRYLQDYRDSSGRLTRWYPTTGQVFTHKHGLLRAPNTDNTVATYDVFDYEGGRSGGGSLKDRTAAYNDQFYLASGAQGAGTYEFLTYIPNPISLVFTGASVIGGRNVNTGGTPIYDFSDEWLYETPGNYTISFSNISGTPDNLILEMVGGGGSGAAGTASGNNGGDSVVKVGDGSKAWVTCGGGGGGGATNGASGGQAGAAGSFSNQGALSIIGVGGVPGGQGVSGVTSQGWPAVDYPNNPNGGGYGAPTAFTPLGDGSPGLNVYVGGQSGTYSQTISSVGTSNFNFSGNIGNPIDVTFKIYGAKGGNARGGRQGKNGGALTVSLRNDQMSTFLNYTWSVILGTKGSNGGTSGGNGGSGNGHSGSGGTGGQGHSDSSGGGGGASSILRRGSTIVAGAGGGGGAGGDGYDGGAGSNGNGPPVGVQAENGVSIGTGSGGTGGRYGCVGGGGGGGGGGCARNGLTFGGSGNGGASGGPGGGPGADGGHGGGSGGASGVSSYRSDIFASGSLGTATTNNGYAEVNVEYNDDYWTPGGGGGGSGASIVSSVAWADLDNPATANVTVGGGGSAASMGGQTTGSSSPGGNGRVRVGLGKIVGYQGGTTTVTIGDVLSEGSQDGDNWDVNIFSGGTGTGTLGSFKLPTNQGADVYIVGDGSGATATATVGANRVTSINLVNAGAGYTEVPYVYVMNGAGSVAVAATTIDPASGAISTLQQVPATSSAYTHYVKFGGSSASNPTRFVVTVPVDTEDANYFSIKCCRGNGVNGGDTPEEVLRAYYRLAGQPTWNLLDTIVNPNATRNDPIIGNVPPISQAWDGAAGDTKWYTYSVSLPSQAKAVGTQFKVEQPRGTANSANDNDSNTDHYGIAEFIIWNEKVSELVFVPTAGAISRPAVDSLSYTIQGETGPGITYSSGLGCNDATLTMKSTTKIEPQATIDPDFHIPLIHPYRLCKYLIKAF